MGRKLDSMTGAVIGAAGALAASQWREYLQQYRQRLGGHLDEARGQVLHLSDLRELAGEAQRQVVSNMMAASQARADSLAETLRALAEATPPLQPVVFVRHFDPVAARATLESFQPALPMDAASLAWAVAGLVGALMLYELVKGLLWGLLWAPVAITKRALRPPRSTAKRSRRDPLDTLGPDGQTQPMRERREPRLES